jgi:hypothetical protein
MKMLKIKSLILFSLEGMFFASWFNYSIVLLFFKGLAWGVERVFDLFLDWLDFGFLFLKKKKNPPELIILRDGFEPSTYGYTILIQTTVHRSTNWAIEGWKCKLRNHFWMQFPAPHKQLLHQPPLLPPKQIKLSSKINCSPISLQQSFHFNLLVFVWVNKNWKVKVRIQFRKLHFSCDFFWGVVMALTFPLFLLESNKVCVLVGLDLGKGAILLLSLLNFAFPFYEVLWMGGQWFITVNY